MHVIYALARLFPFWGVPLALLIGELGLYFRRRRSGSQWLFFGGAVVMIVLVILWLVFRGDLNSDQWLREFFG